MRSTAGLGVISLFDAAFARKAHHIVTQNIHVHWKPYVGENLIHNLLSSLPYLSFIKLICIFIFIQIFINCFNNNIYIAILVLFFISYFGNTKYIENFLFWRYFLYIFCTQIWIWRNPMSLPTAIRWLSVCPSICLCCFGINVLEGLIAVWSI